MNTVQLTYSMNVGISYTFSSTVQWLSHVWRYCRHMLCVYDLTAEIYIWFSSHKSQDLLVTV